MKLSEALSIAHSAPQDSEVFEVSLACGFTPLHLAAYISAYVQRSLPECKVNIVTGLYGDLSGTVQGWIGKQALTAIIVIEWADLDLRLSSRHLGGWGPKAIPGILEEVENKLRILKKQILSLSPSCQVLVVAPTLPLPPFFHTISDQASRAELVLNSLLADFLYSVIANPAVSVLRGENLLATSPIDKRYDFRSDLNTGFPYALGHADAIGQAIGNLLFPVAPKKGLVTDLDDTLWLGLVGESGADGVFWDLANHAQIHGLYQQMLQTLADQGVLIGVASKNTREVAEQALDRSDCCIRKESLFPLEIHWEPKSKSITRILKAWNIGADSVVFVDDNAMELEEVKAVHPGVECILFPKSDNAAFWQLLNRLRDLFGKPRVSEEDTYRLTSIRHGSAFVDAEISVDQSEGLLAGAQAEITLDFRPDPADARLLELINKTNQFNLNGKRLTDAEWQRKLADPQMLTIAVQYKDKFGPLGKIAALQAKRDDGALEIESWVMSCRAFSRRIEHQVLSQLFDTGGASCVKLRFATTPKNAPIKDFLASLLERAPQEGDEICKDVFFAKCPALYHQVTKLNG